MGCGESCPYISGVPVLDWPLPDPKGQGIEPVRLIRDDAESRVRALVKEHALGLTPANLAHRIRPCAALGSYLHPHPPEASCFGAPQQADFSDGSQHVDFSSTEQQEPPAEIE